MEQHRLAADRLGAAAFVQVEGEWNDDLMKQVRKTGPIQN